MLSIFRIFSIFIFLVLLNPSAFSQNTEKEPEKKFNTKYQPIQVIKRLSYENYKNLKLLHAAMINFGGGEAEFDRLVDDYAEASALYFANKIIESANLFTKNEADILKAAIDLAKKYKDVTAQLHKDTIRMKVKTGIKLSFKGIKLSESVEKAVDGGAFSFNKANDYEVRTRPVDAIYYYRRAKDNYFQAYKILSDFCADLADKSNKKDDKEYFTRLADKYKLPPDKYQKDMVDNQNQIYYVREKEK